MKNEKMKRKHLVTIRLTDSEYSKMLDLCKHLNISISYYFRVLSLTYLYGGGFFDNENK